MLVLCSWEFNSSVLLILHIATVVVGLQTFLQAKFDANTIYVICLVMISIWWLAIFVRSANLNNTNMIS